MGRSIEDAQRDLREFMANPIPLDFKPPGLLTDIPQRRSSVLILFGALDSTAAQTGDTDDAGNSAHATPAVHKYLDVLLTRRSDTMRHHPGQIAFPGGGDEPADGGDPVRTALREAQEETGLDPSGVEVLGHLPPIHVPVSSNLVTPVIGWWRLPSEVAADHSESVDVFRAPVAELLDPRHRGTSMLRHASRVHRAPAFELNERFGGRVVWGFTGILLAHLFDNLGWTVPWDETREFTALP